MRKKQNDAKTVTVYKHRCFVGHRKFATFVNARGARVVTRRNPSGDCSRGATVTAHFLLSGYNREFTHVDLALPANACVARIVI